MEIVKIFVVFVLIASPGCGELLTLMLAETGIAYNLDDYFIYYIAHDNDAAGYKDRQPVEDLVQGGSFRSPSLGAWQSGAFYVSKIYYLVLNERGQVLFNISLTGVGQNLWWYFGKYAYEGGLPLSYSDFSMNRVGDAGLSFRVWDKANASRLFLGALNANLFVPGLHTQLLLSSSNTFSTLPPSGYMGCVVMTEVENKLEIAALTSDMTVIKCVQECDGRGHTHAALKGGDACLCGTNLTATKFGACDIRCKGNSQFVCGGGSATSIYGIQGFQSFGLALASIEAANDVNNAQQVFSLELGQDEEIIELSHMTHVTSLALSHDGDVTDPVNFTLTYSGVTDRGCEDTNVTYLPLMSRAVEPNSTEELQVVSNVTTTKDVALARMTCLKVKRSWSGIDAPPNVTLQAFGPTGDFIIVPAVAVQIETSPVTTVQTTTVVTTPEPTTEETCDCCDLCPTQSAYTLTDLLTTCYGLLPSHVVPSNMTLSEYVELVQEELRVVKSALSAERRKLTSVVDNRPSAQALGTIAAIVITSPFAVVFLFDCLRVLKAKHLLTTTGPRRSHSRHSVHSARTDTTVVSHGNLHHI